MEVDALLGEYTPLDLSNRFDQDDQSSNRCAVAQICGFLGIAYRRTLISPDAEGVISWK